MTVEAKDLCRQLGIENARLDVWVEAGWVSPRRRASNAVFSAMDRARIELILDLSGPMGVNDEGVAIILDLLDQIHGLRHALRGMTSVVSVKSPSVGRRVGSEVARNARSKHAVSPNEGRMAGA